MQIDWDRFVEMFEEHQVRTKETYAEYIKASKDIQGDIKDVGGFVGGKLKGGSRKQVELRDFVCLDIDYAKSLDEVQDIINMAYPDTKIILYSTHKHCPKSPRLRLVFALSRSVDPETYIPLARKIAESIGIEMFDITTYQPSRMMYWQSTSSDGEQVCEVFNGKDLDVDAILGMYDDYTDVSQWPKSERETKKLRKTAEKMENPLTKAGPVGLFCRAYEDIREAIEKYVPDYEPVAGDPNRYTYTKGTSKGGVLIFDNGLFSYSYHNHDPCCGQEVNAFDLVRIQKFGELDKNKDPEKTRVTSLPSYKAMLELIDEDEKVIELKAKEMVDDFDFLGELPEEEKEEYAKAIQRLGKALKGPLKRDGSYPLSNHNLEVMFKLHPDLCPDKDGTPLLAFDEFKRRIVLRHAVRWRKITEADNGIRDADDAMIRKLFGAYGMRGKDLIYDETVIEAQNHAFHPVREYLEGLEWDGTKRIDTMLIDFFGGEPSEYNLFISRLFFKAAVMRVYNPGCKFDLMLTVKGPQGTGKSTVFKRLGRDWFSDSIKDLRTKDAYEGLQGAWIVEFGELSAMKKADAELIKSFLSATNDRIRVPYGRRTEDYPRQCVFVATTNEIGFLYDKTGNRRFLIFEMPKTRTTKLDFYTDLNAAYVDQLWAEAYEAVKSDSFKSDLGLPKAIEETAAAIQKSFMQDDPVADTIERYLEIMLPDDWYSDVNPRDMTDRRAWIQDALMDRLTEGMRANCSIRRDKVCAAEIWVEALGHSDTKDMNRSETQNINRILDNLPGWKRAKNEKGGLKTVRFEGYGTQKGFIRVTFSPEK